MSFANIARYRCGGGVVVFAGGVVPLFGCVEFGFDGVTVEGVLVGFVVFGKLLVELHALVLEPVVFVQFELVPVVEFVFPLVEFVPAAPVEIDIEPPPGVVAEPAVAGGVVVVAPGVELGVVVVPGVVVVVVPVVPVCVDVVPVVAPVVVFGEVLMPVPVPVCGVVAVDVPEVPVCGVAPGVDEVEEFIVPVVLPVWPAVPAVPALGAVACAIVELLFPYHWVISEALEEQFDEIGRTEATWKAWVAAVEACACCPLFMAEPCVAPLAGCPVIATSSPTCVRS